MKDKGIILDPETGDLHVKPVRNRGGKITGGFVVDDVTRQNQAIIMAIHPGELKEKPARGVGISGMLLSEETLSYKHKIREQLAADGQHVSYLALNITNDNQTEIQLNASY